MIEDTLLQVLVAGIGTFLLVLLAGRDFFLARKLDESLQPFFERLPRAWEPGARLISAILRPRNLGPLVIILGLVLWMQDRHQDAALCWLMTAGMATAELLKKGIKRPRPSNEFVVLHRIKTLSFPSGHASSAMLASLVIVSVFAPLPIVATLVVLAGLKVGASRVYLRVHHPSDVLGGWLFAIVWWQLCLFITEYNSWLQN